MPLDSVTVVHEPGLKTVPESISSWGAWSSRVRRILYTKMLLAMKKPDPSYLCARFSVGEVPVVSLNLQSVGAALGTYFPLPRPGVEGEAAEGG